MKKLLNFFLAGRTINGDARWTVAKSFSDRLCLRRYQVVNATAGNIEMAKEQGTKITDEASGDLASGLIAEFVVWFQNLGAKGILPRAFTGVTNDGKQAVIVLTGLPLDHIQRREFLIWLCRNEGFVAYAYGTHVGIAKDTSTVTECLDIYASSNRYDASKTLRIEEQDGTIQFFDQHHAVLPTNHGNGIFFGLQRSDEIIPSNNDRLFRELWAELKSNCMWRQR